MNKQEHEVIMLPTDKASKLVMNNKGGLWFNSVYSCKSGLAHPQHFYILSNEEIKEGDWYENNGVIFKADDVFNEGNNPNNSNPRVTDFNNKIILTTDKDLEGVQAIDDEFLEWFVKNPSCEEVEVITKKLFDGFLDPEYGSSKWRFEYKIIIPKEEPKQETQIILLPTDKPSKLHTYKGVLNSAAGEFVAPTIVKNDLINQNIYITNDEEIKEGDWFLNETNKLEEPKQETIINEKNTNSRR